MHPWILRGLRQRTGCGKDRIGYLAYCGVAISWKGFLRSHRAASVRVRFLCSRGSGQENPMGRGPLVIIS